MSDPTAGEVGGVFAGLVALLIALGHGLRWWLGWTDRRAITRAAKLDAWQKELAAREQRFDERQGEHWDAIEAELSGFRGRDAARDAEMNAVRIEHTALCTAYQLIASALRATDPDNPALGHADEILKAAFPLEIGTPASMLETLRKIK